MHNEDTNRRDFIRNSTFLGVGAWAAPSVVRLQSPGGAELSEPPSTLPPFVFVGFQRDINPDVDSAAFYYDVTTSPEWKDAAGVRRDALASPFESGTWLGRSLTPTLKYRRSDAIDGAGSTTVVLTYLADDRVSPTYDLTVEYVTDVDSYTDPTVMMPEGDRRGGDLRAFAANGYRFVAAFGWRPPTLPVHPAADENGWYPLTSVSATHVESIDEYTFAAEFVLEYVPSP